MPGKRLDLLLRPEVGQTSTLLLAFVQLRIGRLEADESLEVAPRKKSQ